MIERGKEKGIKVVETESKNLPKGAAAMYISNKGLYNKWAKGHLEDLRKNGKLPKDFEVIADNFGNAVVAKGEKNAFVVGHEIGHGVNDRSFWRHLPKSTAVSLGIKGGALYGGYKAGKAKNKDEERKGQAIGAGSIIAGNLRTPLDEHLASQYSLKELKKMGVSKKSLEKARKYANYNTTMYLKPKGLVNPATAGKILIPLAIHGTLYGIGHLAGELSKERDEDKKSTRKKKTK